MENTGIADQILLNVGFLKHHVCTGIAVKGKITVSIRISMYKSQGGVDFFINDKIAGVDSNFLHGGF